MKNLYLLSITYFAISFAPLQSWGLLPKIDQVKNKINEVGKSLPTVNFKELFDKSVVQQNPDGTICRILSRDPLPQDDPQSLQKQIDELYWCKQEKFMQELQNSSQNKQASFKILYAKLTEHYPQNSRLLVTFSADLMTEEKKLDEIINAILKKLSSDTKNQAQLKTNFNTATTLKKVLQTFINQINTLLLNN